MTDGITASQAASPSYLDIDRQVALFLQRGISLLGGLAQSLGLCGFLARATSVLFSIKPCAQGQGSFFASQADRKTLLNGFAIIPPKKTTIAIRQENLPCSVI